MLMYFMHRERYINEYHEVPRTELRGIDGSASPRDSKTPDSEGQTKFVLIDSASTLAFSSVHIDTRWQRLSARGVPINCGWSPVASG